MADEIKIPRRVLGLILSSVSAGIVPRLGASYIAIGRTDELSSLVRDLEFTADGGGCMRFIIGKYGSGKSFLMTLIRGYALEHNFVTADCDLSPERRLCGAGSSGAQTYRELMKNLSVRSSPEGNALSGILSKWLSSLSSKLVLAGTDPSGASFETAMKHEVFSVCSSLENFVGGFDFANVLMQYYSASKAQDEMKKSDILRWLRGEYTTKSAAKASLRVFDIIDDDNWYDYIKLWTAFFRIIGYSGFAVFIDECVNLYKIPNRISREKNYEKILSMFNDSLGGASPGLSVFMGGTPQFLEDGRRGLYSYEALRSRLCDGRFVRSEYKNLMGPIIRLRRMSDNELLALVKRMTILHGQYYGYAPSVSDSEMQLFTSLCLSRAGADSMITPREIIREYISVLDVMLQNPGLTFTQIIGDDGTKIDLRSDRTESDDIGFEEFDVL